ncbi:tRNA 2-selenouridine(34) synthase MnmH [Sulfitobacter albidus]|uniref:tRNA 2-selenouridine(34) synthase MnmH n=1 Tax=Sulfitobacter albidus TaxID=2829501 RepID=A0A975JH42_9RHOB|nr:tRNA 2-selenouridine(34) synthase MnmH [Sulfitobacter albidus]QUJ78192.1 tRNA 2-selenouridine(34) synthase MnmH [Sulfitobacter albidus]
MTPLTLSNLTDLTRCAADTIIDVRAPSEFAEDHLPGAINLPVLSDSERAEVGTIYTQQSPFLARKIGAALVAANAARHLQGPLAEKPGDWQPLVYCWRGGQRSNAFATILDQVGWRVQLLQGGYRSYRRQVVATLYDRTLSHRLRIVSGGTGTAKTAILQALRARGAQVIDLEGLAAHRGSLFGGHGDQPSQKMFESRLAGELDTLDPQRTLWIEAESSRVGARILPPALWAAMGAAPRVEITAPLDARAAHLVATYADLRADPAMLADRIDHLRPFHAAKQIAHWHDLARSAEWRALAAELIARHYDPRYAKAKTHRQGDAALHLGSLDTDALNRAAEDLIDRFS